MKKSKNYAQSLQKYYDTRGLTLSIGNTFMNMRGGGKNSIWTGYFNRIGSFHQKDSGAGYVFKRIIEF